MTGPTLSALRGPLAAHGIHVIEEVETSVAVGTFVPRGASDTTRIAPLTRSWEAFDRVYRQLDEVEERALLRRCLWPALDDTVLQHLPADATHGMAFALGGECVGIWPGDAWTRRVQSWKLARSSSVL